MLAHARPNRPLRELKNYTSKGLKANRESKSPLRPGRGEGGARRKDRLFWGGWIIVRPLNVLQKTLFRALSERGTKRSKGRSWGGVDQRPDGSTGNKGTPVKRRRGVAVQR